MGYSLGIDLGTTFTAAALVNGAGVRMASLTHDGVAVPSVLTRGDDGMVVGSQALAVAATRPWLVVREFKRRFGDETPFIVGDERLTADALTGMLFEWVVKTVADGEGGPPEQIVITHPAAWSGHRLALLDRATSGVAAPRQFLPEPSAAAIHYHQRTELADGAVIAVYDLGGGTFDATVVRRVGDGYELLGTPLGIERLGGLDFDQAVFDLVVASLPEVFAELDPDDTAVQRSVARLREECTRAKIALSFDSRAVVPVVLPGLAQDILVSRRDFEDRIRPQVSYSVATLGDAIDAANVAPGDLAGILLVGGSSRVPLVAEMIHAALEIPVAIDTHPKHAVALGAALSVVSKPVSFTSQSLPSAPSIPAATEPTSIPEATVDISEALDALPARLVVINGPQAGEAFPVGPGSCLVGRSESADVVLRDPSVSRRHLLIDRRGAVFHLTDLGSTAGTRVGARPVAEAEPVGSGDLIEIGATWVLIDGPLGDRPAIGPVLASLSGSMVTPTGTIVEPPNLSVGAAEPGMATVGFGTDPARPGRLEPIRLGLAGHITDIALPGGLGEDLLRSLLIEVSRPRARMPLAVIGFDPTEPGWAFARPWMVPTAAALAGGSGSVGLWFVRAAALSSTELEALAAGIGPASGVVGLMATYARMPRVDQRIDLDRETALLRVGRLGERTTLVTVAATVAPNAVTTPPPHPPA